MARTLQVAAIGLIVLFLLGMLFPLIWRTRVASDRARCQDHLRELGLMGVRHASVPGKAVPPVPRDDLPPGTFENQMIPVDQRMSWYVYTIAVLDGGPPNPDPQAKHRRPPGLSDLLAKFDSSAAWNASSNAELANFRLTTAICPAQVTAAAPGSPSNTNYIALGGIGVDTPALTLEIAGKNAGAYRVDGYTPIQAFRDGLRQTAQLIETNFDIGPWLQGGSPTLRGLDVSAEPYLGIGRPFGGCHPGGAFASMADGSIRFLKDTIDPAVFRALLTLAGGIEEQGFDDP